MTAAVPAGDPGALPVSGVDGLRQQLERLIHAGIVGQWHGRMRDDVALTDPRPIVRELLPVVTAWAEQQARQRAAEELRAAARDMYHSRMLATESSADWLYDRGAALTDDGQP